MKTIILSLSILGIGLLEAPSADASVLTGVMKSAILVGAIPRTEAISNSNFYLSKIGLIEVKARDNHGWHKDRRNFIVREITDLKLRLERQRKSAGPVLASVVSHFDSISELLVKMKAAADRYNYQAILEGARSARSEITEIRDFALERGDL